MSVNRNPWPGAFDTSPANGQHAGQMPRWATASATIASFATQLVRGHSDIYVPLATASVAGTIAAADKAKLDTLSTTLPHCRVYNSANISVATATNVALTFDSERYDTHAFHSTSSNTSRLTIPAGLAGTYLVGGSFTFNTAAGGNRRIGQLRANGSLMLDVWEAGPTGASTFPSVSLGTLVELAVNDYVELIAFQDSGAAVNVLAIAAQSPEIWLVRTGG